MLNIYFVQNSAAHYNCNLFNAISREKNIENVVVITRSLIGPVEKNLKGVNLHVKPNLIKYLLEIMKAASLKHAIVVYDGHSSSVASVALCITGLFFRLHLILWSLGAVPSRPKGLRGKFGDILAKLYCYSSEYIVCYGSHAKQYFASLGISVNKLYIAQNALPLPEIGIMDQYHKDNSRSEEVKVVFVGALRPQKNIDLLVKVIAHHPNIKLDIIGDGPCLEEFRSMVIKYNADNIVFVGPLFGSDLSKRLVSYQFAILPGLGGLAINTALSHGLPVICGPADGTEQDLVIDGYTGLLLQSVTFKSLETAILNLSGKLTLCEEMGSNGQKLISKKYTVKEQAKVFMDIFNQVGI